MRFKLTTLILIIVLQSCNGQIQNESVSQDSILHDSIFPDHIEIKSIEEPLNSKIKTVHIFVPLCDNENQGIVPVNSSLGNGTNLRTNLYWGAGYGIKSYFKKLKDWELIHSTPISDTLLERVVFKKNLPDSSVVYLIADAYNGACMKQCLEDYFHSLNGHLSDYYSINDSLNIPIYNKSNLIIFNGHNGLMDTEVELFEPTNTNRKETIAIACYSFSYFKNYWENCKAIPILSTTHLLAPEAYTIEASLNKWSTNKENIEIRNAAAKAYSNKHTCSYKTAQKLFKTGW